VIDIVDVLNRLLAWYEDSSKPIDPLWDEVREIRDALTGAPPDVTSCPLPWADQSDEGREFDHGCSAAFPTFPLRTPGARQNKEDHEVSKELVTFKPKSIKPVWKTSHLLPEPTTPREKACPYCGLGTLGEGRDGANACPMGCADKHGKNEPQVTGWYTTVFALYDGKPYTTVVAVTGKSTTQDIVEAARRQCAEDYHLIHIPALVIAAIIVGEHESMV
jgi:hypothetical protein